MDLSSWFRRGLSSASTKTKNPNLPNQSHPDPQQEEEEELFGVTEQLIEFVKSFTFDTFNNFPLQEHANFIEVGADDEGAACGDVTPSTSGNVRKDPSEWQERHALLVITKVKYIFFARAFSTYNQRELLVGYMLCPRRLRERQFWRIYFMLVKSYVIEYELRAVQLAKLESMAMENEKSSETSVYEVEMAEAKHTESLMPPTP
ncbi:uncharacterized protein LOC132165847 [Corylus avellana]|uniref:uncharacterized protein LOC132165847 n=1 Tax=Corylus avellana TaxID=13451 RepID=UPI00286A946F|nr:uncharacterized protein LOC132165847 [Corylus avellana]